MKYSDLICKWLQDLGYTHCFSVGGGNIMHLVESASRYFTVIPTVHEVACGIAAECFNETETGKKAFALVTAGPGLTNIVTGVAGAFLESRELLVIGGQVKTSDLANGTLRQRGIQEIDGVSILKPICKESICLRDVIDSPAFSKLVNSAATPRKGPVFIEFPLDLQARTVDIEVMGENAVPAIADDCPTCATEEEIEEISTLVRSAKRPVILLGGGVSRNVVRSLKEKFSQSTLVFMTSWNACDRLDANDSGYFGRPNNWGQRYSNVLIQQSDLLVALGDRLGMQQTGFNWQSFIPNGKIIHVDCDRAELEKGHPYTDYKFQVDANDLLIKLFACDLGNHTVWRNYCRNVKSKLPLYEVGANQTGDDYIAPHSFCNTLSELCNFDDVIIPCSSGGAFTVMMGNFVQKEGQLIICNKGLASMGYGLSAAIGAAASLHPRRTILTEGDGGFLQNMQELGTVAANKLNLKIFIFDDNGYASIRMTQKNYFSGKYVGCDINTGLGFPDWEKLCEAYDIPVLRINRGFAERAEFKELFTKQGPAAFIVTLDPEQTYLPKIASRVLPNGSMESNPIHLMHPPLDDELMQEVGKYLTKN